MPSVRFSSLSNPTTDAKIALLAGSFYHGVISLTSQGIFRIFVYHRLEDADKGSFSVERDEHELVPISIAREKATNSYILSSANPSVSSAPLRVLSLDPFKYQWGTLDVLQLEAHRIKDLGSISDYMALTLGEGDPYSETCDGLVMGNGMTLQLAEKPGRHYYGLGERSGFLDKKGRVYVNWTTDEWDHKEDIDPLYVACPFILAADYVDDESTKPTDGSASKKAVAWGMFLDETWRTAYDLAYTEPDRSYIRSDGPTFDLYLIPGPHPTDVVSLFGALTGRPLLPPLWALGYHQCRWSYPDEQTVRSIVERYSALDLPLDAIWMDIDYMDGFKVFTFNQHRFPDMKRLTDDMWEKYHVRTVAIVDPGVKKEAGYHVYESGKALGAFVQNRRDEEWVGKVWPDPAVWPDFTRPEVRKWWGDLHLAHVEKGIAGIWNDMNEPSAFNDKRTLPLGAKHGGKWHAEVHNVYGQQMCRATQEGLLRLQPEKRPFVLTRSGFPGVQRYSWIWTGDNTSYWAHLEMSIPTILNMGLSALAFVGSDIGGFKNDCTGELLVRWTWFSSLLPFMRNHSAKGSRRQEPWTFGEPFLSYCRNAIKFRYRLLPYLYTLLRKTCLTGLPVVRPLFLEFFEDAETACIGDQFMLGSSLMAAPVLHPSQSHRMAYLPPGARWVDFWSGKEVTCGWQIMDAPLADGIPLFQRLGSAVPLTRSALYTTTALWQDALHWRIPLVAGPTYSVSGEAYEDDGEGPVHQDTCLGMNFGSRVLKAEVSSEQRTARVQLTMSPNSSTVELVVAGVADPVLYKWDGEGVVLLVDLDNGAVTPQPL
mmetsp:Transcript_15535/g.25700  ORF Transcript_15535/g.25700 Transcript_15535/m.25700 type:complete len:821 (+) Transcript_15535:141-2603(+)|eukprot:CAMPEP_0184335206 /NCGR_PEP_ID=MMETSP1089-20130417/3813_1 /TAXON_ID=38269 ORGANISM="Gloeochaete wittrockiana, Strain SAG46.84" /NCGR_SAMPLE_ID=MMETSP1089 /ASSEMBLY_ACC=CAM_ASM_000445 /LENGTH=820 /DNA_ID=CAMNT_0026659759 /DNA_START=84 /DNA_END=2546 /DNA_ORIENTATION=+